MIESIDASIERAIAATGRRDLEIVVRSAWLQKHPSPAANGGEFHWYPAGGDRELRADLVERIRGLEPPAVLWELSRGRVVWARAFAAQAPFDNRRYVGLAVTVVESPGAAPVDLLETLVDPAASPWTPDRALDMPPPGEWPALDRAGDRVAIARALISGGTLGISERAHGSLVTELAAIEAWIPRADDTRRGVFRQRSQAEEAGTAPGNLGDRVAELAIAATDEPLSPRARGWRVLCELAAAREQSVDDVAAQLEVPAFASLTDEERAALRKRTAQPILPARPSTAELVDILHAWGRGWFDLCPTAGSLTERLADAVALSALADLAGGADPRRAMAEARWYAVLPAERRARLFDTLIERARSLSAFAEVPHG